MENNQLQASEWVKIFKEINGREPSAAEYNEAIKKGEISSKVTSNTNRPLAQPQQPAFSQAPVTPVNPSPVMSNPQGFPQQNQMVTGNSSYPQQRVAMQANYHLTPDIKGIKRDINKVDTEIAEAFFNLGLAYYESRINQGEDHFENEIDQLIQLNKKSYSLKKDLHRLAYHKKTCLNCGATIVDGARFCTDCGSNQQEIETIRASHRIVCDVCQVEQIATNKFCGCCGKSFV